VKLNGEHAVASKSTSEVLHPSMSSFPCQSNKYKVFAADNESQDCCTHLQEHSDTFVPSRSLSSDYLTSKPSHLWLSTSLHVAEQ
jgi:hypothetical protein